MFYNYLIILKVSCMFVVFSMKKIGWMIQEVREYVFQFVIIVLRYDCMQRCDCLNDLVMVYFLGIWVGCEVFENYVLILDNFLDDEVYIVLLRNIGLEYRILLQKFRVTN